MNKTTRNAEYIKQYNRKKILSLLSIECLSRAELARRTGLTRSAISIIVDELLGYQILIEHEAVAQKRGRSPAPLSLNPDRFCAVGVYLNRRSCQIGLVDIYGKCLVTRTIPIYPEEPVSEVLDEAAGQIRRILCSHPASEKELLGIGVSTPGPVNVQSGRIVNPPNFEQWHHVAICEEFKKRLHYPIYMSDNADALAIYNMRYGHMKKNSDFMLLLVDSGIGSGIISNGKLHRGVFGMSPEIGHITIRHTGKPCSCGNIGCLEMYAAIPNLLAEFGGIYPSWEAVMEAAQNGEEDACRILDTEAGYLVAGITSVINLFYIDTIVLAGDILSHFPLMECALREKLPQQTLLKDLAPLAVMASDTRENYDIISAANIVFTAHLDS